MVPRQRPPTGPNGGTGARGEVISPGAASAEAKLLVSLAAQEANLVSITDARCKMMEKYVEGSLTAQEMKLTSATEKLSERIDALELLFKAHQARPSSTRPT